MTQATPSPDKIFQVGISQLDYHEGANNYNKYAAAVGVPNNDAWCTTFASWEFLTAGFKSLCLMSDYSIDQLNWFSARGRASAYPAVGALVWLGPGGGDHTAWVYGYDADYIYTIEGNWNNQVLTLKRPRRVAGPGGITPYMYGLPAFAEGIVSADPNHTVAGSVYAPVASVDKTPGSVPPPVTPPPPVPGSLPWVSYRQISAASASSSGVAVVDGDSSKDDVLNYQKGLKKLVAGYDYSSGPGTFGPLTHAATKTFQLAQGWTGSNADGNVGPATVTDVGTKSGLFQVRDFDKAPPVTPPPPPPPSTSGWVYSVPINEKSGVSYARYTSGGTVSQWIAKALDMRGVTDPAARANWTKGYVTAIGRESSGDANACNTNDSNNVTPSGYSRVSDYGNGYGSPGGVLNGILVNYQCSRGVAQCIPQTFAENHCPGSSNMIYDPVANILASMGYVTSPTERYKVKHDGSDLAAKIPQFNPAVKGGGY